MHSLYVVYLDRHHLGDDLFRQSLAQRLSEAGTGAPTCVLAHGSGEKVERTLEAQGHFPERTDGVLDVETEKHRRLVERAVREVNQELVATLTDQVVSTVGVQGVDRGLFQKDPDGPLRAVNVGWLSALLKQHVVPVVSALVRSPDTGVVQEVWTAEAVAALAQALEASFDPVGCVLTTADRPGLPNGEGDIEPEVQVDAVTDEHVPDPSALQHLSDAGIPLLITSLQGLFREGTPRGTRVRS